MTFKNIRIPKIGGGSRLQRVKVLASGKYKFVKNLAKSRSRSSKKTKTKSKKRGYPKMGKKNRKRGKNLQATLFRLIRLGALVAPAAYTALEHKDDMYWAVEHGVYRYTGWSGARGKWEPKGLLEGWGPFLGACLATYGIPKLVSFIRRL